MHPLERSETVAVASYFDAAPAAVAAAHGLAVERAGEAVCVIARALPGVRDLNRVLGAGPATDPAELLRVYDGVEHIVAVAPETGELEARLRAAGYADAYAWMKFARPADPEAHAPTDLRLAEVDPADGADFAGPVAAGFGMPPFMREVLTGLPGLPGWTCFAAYDADGRAVAGAALVVAGDQGWLGMGATRPEARGHGAQSALLARRIRAAAERGCSVVTTETGVMQDGRPAGSYRNILRAGFEEAYVRPNLVSPPG